MKVIIALAVLVAVVVARPEGDADATVLRYVNSQPGPDGFNWNFETSNGISHEQVGELKDAGTDHAAIHYHGQYSYTDEKTGKLITVTYTATDAGAHYSTKIE